MKKRRKLMIYMALLGSAASAGLYAVSTGNSTNPAVNPANLASVEKGTIVRSVVATGRIEPITKVEVKSKANGIIEVIHVDVGDLVRPGDILVELDRENAEARVREAHANLKAARAALEVAQAELEKNSLEAAGPDVDFYRRTHDRALALFRQKLVAQADVEKTKADLELAENRQDVARSQLPITRAKIVEAEAIVAQASAAVERAEEELANTIIRAPIRGTVLSRDVEIGSPVSSILNLGAAATLVMTLGDIDRVFVRGKVDESDIGWVRLNQPARISVETFKDRSFEGKVTQISPIGEEKDNVTTFEVEVSIENAGKDLKANMTANAEIVLEEHTESLLVPLAAVVYDPQKKTYLDLLALDRPEGRRRVEVKLGIGNGIKTEVLEGVREGDKVILP